MDNNYFDALIDEIEKKQPPFLRAKNLIELSLYPSPAAVSISCSSGQSPPFIKLGNRKIVFPRASLCAWLREKSNKQKPLATA